jgi:hypothetical protein
VGVIVLQTASNVLYAAGNCCETYYIGAGTEPVSVVFETGLRGHRSSFDKPCVDHRRLYARDLEIRVHGRDLERGDRSAETKIGLIIQFILALPVSWKPELAR